MTNGLIASDRTRDRVLFSLKTRGPMQTVALARLLGITVPGVRSHLNALHCEGLVGREHERKGVGRPGLRWSATAAADEMFPDTHSVLTVEMIEAIRAALGEQALAQVIAHRDQHLRKRYRAAVGESGRIDVRLKRLARLRTEEGYMAEVVKDGDGWLFVENHCPICAAAAACQGLCASELELIRHVLGSGAAVARTEYLLEGARRCAYRISGKSPRR